MRTVLFTAALLLGLAVQAQSDKIVGRWTGDDMGEPITLVFDEEGFCTILSGTDVVGGPNMDVGGFPGYMAYEVSFGDPYNFIDLNVYLKEDGSFLGGMPGIFTLDGKEMHICLNFNGEVRPSAFVEDDSLWLTKE
ncbi:MAG: hypothetical protein H6548_09330 [Chitinophagales bacterium]|nr:hypothetical protein [Chitinophagales bacterium]HAE14637.1 hypothetical protein [Bacteroidota bacterium]MCB9019367.1 hypothetical protein [Chitinophagales bacterium]MCB9022309.1 hypothetical protein [Chitinophagales bacterium]HAE35341.1 hypothetical protein [Bacteroidota bacterium]